MSGATIALAPALAIAAEQGVTATVAATLISAMREGMASARRSEEDKQESDAE
jgi:hypothetical protein